MTVKTLAEVHADRVTVTVTLDTDRFDPEQAAEVLAENYERARLRIRELEHSLAARVAEIEIRPESGQEPPVQESPYQVARTAAMIDSIDRLRDKVRQLEHSLAARVAEIEELDEQAAGNAGTIEGLRERISELESDITRRVDNTAELERGRRGWQAKFENEKAERQQNREWAERAEARANKAEATLTRVSELIENEQVRTTIGQAGSRTAVFLGDVINQIRDLVSK